MKVRCPPGVIECGTVFEAIPNAKGNVTCPICNSVFKPKPGNIVEETSTQPQQPEMVRVTPTAGYLFDLDD